MPLWGLPVLVVCAPCRVACPGCGIRVAAIPWSRGKSPLSLPLVVVLATCARLPAWDVVAKLFSVSWGTVVTAVRRAVDYGLAQRDIRGVLCIGIDEVSRRRQHIHHSQVYDLAGKRLLWSGKGRDAASLERFFQEWGPERCQQLQGPRRPASAPGHRQPPPTGALATLAARSGQTTPSALLPRSRSRRRASRSLLPGSDFLTPPRPVPPSDPGPARLVARRPG